MNTHRHKGFIALTTVLVLSAIFVSLSISGVTRAIVGAEAGYTLSAGDAARILSDSCAEYALLKLRQTIEYSGDESILVAGESCHINAVGGVGNSERSIETESTVSGHTYRTRVHVATVLPQVVVTSWTGVDEF